MGTGAPECRVEPSLGDTRRRGSLLGCPWTRTRNPKGNDREPIDWAVLRTGAVATTHIVHIPYCSHGLTAEGCSITAR